MDDTTHASPFHSSTTCDCTGRVGRFDLGRRRLMATRKRENRAQTFDPSTPL